MEKNIILITGPGGSGKTALAEYISNQSNFTMISEDAFWSELKKNQQWDGHRTLEEEEIIQSQIITYIQSLLDRKQNVVLEFILYCNPPRPLIAYKEAFIDIASKMAVVVLNPSAEAIVARKKKRGRESEQNANIMDESSNMINWMKCMDTPYIQKEWIIENQNLTIQETYYKVLERMIP